LVSNFVQDVLDSVFHALQLNGISGSGAVVAVGNFLVGLWGTAVQYAQRELDRDGSATLDYVTATEPSSVASRSLVRSPGRSRAVPPKPALASAGTGSSACSSPLSGLAKD
jgi:hypothetical protein